MSAHGDTAPGGTDAVTAPQGPGVPVEPGHPARQSALRRALGQSPLWMGGVLLVLVLVFGSLESEAFPTMDNFRNILMDASVLMVMAVGMTFVMVAGGFDLSIGSVLVFAGVCGVKAMEALGTDNGLTVLVGLLASMAGGLAWGVFNGWAITKLRVPALITTLGTLGAALGIARLITNGNDVRGVPLSLINVSTGGFLGFSWIIWVAAVVTIVGGLVLATTRFGRHTYVIGSNAEAARRAGIDVDRHLLKLYALSGLLAGLAGMLSLTRFATTTIAGHSTDALQVITGVVLGGTSLFGGIGSMIGTVVGMFIPTVLQNGFIVTNVEPFWQEVAIGFILIAAVYIDQLKRRSRERA
jgi:ribose transport system permease protein